MSTRRFSPLSLLFWVGVAYAAALPGLMFMPDGWYRRLDKPWWTPPDEVFGPVWTVLYALMGIGAYLVCRRDQHPAFLRALTLFFVQLVLNAAYSPLLFGMHRLDLALVCCGLLWLTLLSMVTVFFRIRPAAGWLQIPYLLWVTYATALTGAIWWLNR